MPRNTEQTFSFIQLIQFGRMSVDKTLSPPFDQKTEKVNFLAAKLTDFHSFRWGIDKPVLEGPTSRS